MVIKWNKAAVQQFLNSIQYLEENGFHAYAQEVESTILLKTRNLISNPILYPIDKYRKRNDGSYRAFEVDNYRISYQITKHSIRIVRLRHTSRRTRKY